MKIYFDGEEVSDDEDEIEEEEEEIFNMKPKVKKIEKDKKFDLDSFDYKVARSIVNIHRKKNLDEKFSNWVEENLNHLNSLYKLSGIKCPPNEFYNYIYENTKQNKTKYL